MAILIRLLQFRYYTPEIAPNVDAVYWEPERRADQPSGSGGENLNSTQIALRSSHVFRFQRRRSAAIGTAIGTDASVPLL